MMMNNNINDDVETSWFFQRVRLKWDIEMWKMSRFLLLFLFSFSRFFFLLLFFFFPLLHYFLVSSIIFRNSIRILIDHSHQKSRKETLSPARLPLFSRAHFFCGRCTWVGCSWWVTLLFFFLFFSFPLLCINHSLTHCLTVLIINTYLTHTTVGQIPAISPVTGAEIFEPVCVAILGAPG